MDDNRHSGDSTGGGNPGINDSNRNTILSSESDEAPIVSSSNTRTKKENKRSFLFWKNKANN